MLIKIMRCHVCVRMTLFVRVHGLQIALFHSENWILKPGQNPYWLKFFSLTTLSSMPSTHWLLATMTVSSWEPHESVARAASTHTLELKRKTCLGTLDFRVPTVLRDSWTGSTLITLTVCSVLTLNLLQIGKCHVFLKILLGKINS